MTPQKPPGSENVSVFLRLQRFQPKSADINTNESSNSGFKRHDDLCKLFLRKYRLRMTGTILMYSRLMSHVYLFSPRGRDQHHLIIALHRPRPHRLLFSAADEYTHAMPFWEQLAHGFPVGHHWSPTAHGSQPVFSCSSTQAGLLHSNFI